MGIMEKETGKDYSIFGAKYHYESELILMPKTHVSVLAE